MRYWIGVHLTLESSWFGSKSTLEPLPPKYLASVVVILVEIGRKVCLCWALFEMVGVQRVVVQYAIILKDFANMIIF